MRPSEEKKVGELASSLVKSSISRFNQTPAIYHISPGLLAIAILMINYIPGKDENGDDMLFDENEKDSIELKNVEGLARQKKKGVDKRLSEMIGISFALTIDVQVRLRWMIGNSKVIHFKKGLAKYAKVSSTHQKCLDLDSSSYIFQKIILL
ncbi:hypothetical protein Tco_0925304 [Tanacetum coccineum]|uniref:Uncharacterized protein n=1 Tax=Tanacetum coccineum TaxID=301880 RepID=A0ABQ5D7Q1_9ASTR